MVTRNVIKPGKKKVLILISRRNGACSFHRVCRPNVCIHIRFIGQNLIRPSVAGLVLGLAARCTLLVTEGS